MIPTKRMIASGIFLDAIETRRFKTETLSISLVAPMTEALTPLHVLALSVLKRGTESFPDQRALNQRLDELYATGVGIRTDRYGDTMLLGVSAEMLDQQYTDDRVDIFDGTLKILLELLFRPRLENGLFPGRHVDSEKDTLCDIIGAQINDPRAYAADRCRRLMFPDSDKGASVLGTVSQLREVTDEHLTEVWRRLISQHPIRIFYVGSKSPDEIQKRLADAMAPYARKVAAVHSPMPGCPPVVSPVKRIEEHMPITQGKLVIGFRSPTHVRQASLYPMLVMNELYGVSPISKLFMNVRERLGLCYYCSSGFDMYRGVLTVSCGVDPKNRGAAEQEIFAQLAEIKKGNIKPTELEAAIRSLVSSYRAISDMPISLESYYAGRELFGVDDTVAQMINRLLAVTPTELAAVACELQPDTVYFLSDGRGGSKHDLV